MKRCPTCNRTYSDETLSFCLDDGSLLSAEYDPDETLVVPGINTNPLKRDGRTGTTYADRPTSGSSFSTYVAIAITALVVGGGIVAFVVYRMNVSVPIISSSSPSETPRKQETSPKNSQNSAPFSTPSPTPIPTPRFTLKDALRTYKYEQGWSGGRANAEDLAKISYFQITYVSIDGDEVMMRYAWKDGVLKGVISGNAFEGTWQQSNGRGAINLRFTNDFQSANGRWNDSDSGESGVAVFRRRE